MNKPQFSFDPHELDELFEQLFGPGSIKAQSQTLSQVFPTSKEVVELQNQIEDMGFILSDRQAMIDALQDIKKSLTERNQELSERYEAQQKDRDFYCSRTCALESQVEKQNEHIEIMKGSLERAQKRLCEQTTIVEQSRSAVATMRVENENLKRKQVSDEHLARQLIRLNEENAKLKDQLKLTGCLTNETRSLRHIINHILVPVLEEMRRMPWYQRLTGNVAKRANDALTFATKQANQDNIQLLL